MLKIRKAKLKDCKECLRLANGGKLMEVDGKPFSLSWIKAFVKEKQICLVAEESEKVVGFAFGGRVAENGCMMQLLSVDKRYQSEGIGGKLVKGFEKEAKKRKMIFIWCYAMEKNKKMIHILKKQKYYKGKNYIEFLKYL